MRRLFTRWRAIGYRLSRLHRENLDAQSGAEIVTLTGHTGSVDDVASLLMANRSLPPLGSMERCGSGPPLTVLQPR